MLRLRYDLGFDYRQIASSCLVGLGTVSEYLKRAKAAGETQRTVVRVPIAVRIPSRL